MATDGREIYWIASDGAVRAQSLTDTVPTPREVCRAPIEGDAEADARPDGASGGGVLDIAVDDDSVYFTEPLTRRIIKCPKQ